MTRCEPAGDRTAHRVTEQVEPLKAQRIRKREQRFGIVVQAGLTGEVVGVAIAGAIPGDYPAHVRKVCELARPRLRRAGDPVQQHERRAGSGSTIADDAARGRGGY